MMEEFSNRTLAGLKQHKFFKLLLPPFKSFLRDNVRKEIEKDRAVIHAAYTAHCNGRPPSDIDIAGLLHKAKEIDRHFVRRNHAVPFSISIQYTDIENIREQRIRLMLEASYQLLAVWDNNTGFRKALHRLYDSKQFRHLILQLLELYITETRLLSNSIKIPRKLSFARNSIVQTITDVMEKSAAELACEFTCRLYGKA